MPGVLISTSLLLTVGLVAGQRARIFPLSGLASGKLPSEIPSLRQVQEAGFIHLKEIPTEDNAFPVSSSCNAKDKRDDWLSLAAREIFGNSHFAIQIQLVILIFSASRSQIYHE